MMAHLLFDYFLHFHRFLLICKLKENLVRGDCVRIEVGDHESKLKKSILYLSFFIIYLKLTRQLKALLNGWRECNFCLNSFWPVEKEGGAHPLPAGMFPIGEEL